MREAASFGGLTVKQVCRGRTRRVEQTNDNPRSGILMDGPNEKVAVVLFDHLFLKSLLDAALKAIRPVPTMTPRERRRQFRVIEGGHK